MIIHFLRENRYASYGLLVLRLYLGWQWLHAGWEKISGGQFDASGFLLGAVEKMTGEHPAVQPWWGTFLKEFALPNVEIFNALIPWGEFLVGLGLILGLFTSYAALMGLVMNFSYLLSGTTSTNPQMVILGFVVLVAGVNAGRIGVDRWISRRAGKSSVKNSDPNALSESA
ncbi:DoxX family protein [Pseudobacillus wudalianchiensis]|uniref:Crp/Fnr family transcriptional regulator n=1 Tax=Pseudobacillus wudalianchiensis TaxID=1743143 RepID=A0A1B9AY98_9BACI|nr:DoxX family protein [Bacillus wudalianchiensis]OCA88892.1 Crp/Fnr family transcriptional regulator [Bacillus wudalianchiensis]